MFGGKLYFSLWYQYILSGVYVLVGRKVIDRARLEGLGGIYSSPVAGAGRIYFTDRKGTTLVIRDGDELEVLATNQLDDSFHSSPALAGDRLFLRGMRALYCLQEVAGESGAGERAR